MWQIVAGLTGAAEGCKASELSQGNLVTLEIQDRDEGGNDLEGWTPHPTDAVPDKMSLKRPSSGIIRLLASIYASKDIFIDDNRVMLAEGLLHQFNCNTAREICDMELLKQRIGDLHYCEVMLKDMTDSRKRKVTSERRSRG